MKRERDTVAFHIKKDNAKPVTDVCKILVYIQYNVLYATDTGQGGEDERHGSKFTAWFFTTLRTGKLKVED